MIKFKSEFLNKQYQIGNISFNPVTRGVIIRVSCDFEEVEGDKHKHRNKISAYLRKEGYCFLSVTYGYVK